MNKADTDTLLLTRSDIEKIVTMKEAIGAMRDVFSLHAKKSTKSYPRVHIPFEQHNGSIGYMESAVDSMGFSACKVASLYHENPLKGLPRIIAMIILSRIDNGVPVAVMDGNFLTMLRTGGVAALAADYLATQDASFVGIIGAGVQGRGQLSGLVEIRNVKKVAIYDISKEASEKFAKEASKKYGIESMVVDSVSQLRQCDIIASATPSKTPLVTEELSHAGLHINSVGIGAGLGKKELDYGLLKRSKTVVDDLEVAKKDSLGEAFSEGLLEESDIYATLGELVVGSKKGREGDEVSVFVSAGMAIQDVAIAQLVYKKAIFAGLGTKFNFFA
ncbi:MAG: ornithine cyclodeaminase family protein [Conexivisphaerales archaeon]